MRQFLQCLRPWITNPGVLSVSENEIVPNLMHYYRRSRAEMPGKSASVARDKSACGYFGPAIMIGGIEVVRDLDSRLRGNEIVEIRATNSQQLKILSR
jgi:hypothetical protein